MDLQHIIPIVVAAGSIGLAVMFRLRPPRPRWKLVSVKGDFTAEHHLPEMLPVPPAEQERARKGDFSFDEALGWMEGFVASRRRHPMAAPFQLALRKADFYKQLADRMGRGHWGEVDELAKRLAELDPLDPSASLARGRAMRQMGRLATAVQFYQHALKLQPTHSLALPEFAATCRAIGQPHRFEESLAIARRELGETHPLTIESRVQLGELVRIFADPMDPATMAHVPRAQYIQNIESRLEEMDADPAQAMEIGRVMLNDDMPELALFIYERASQTFGDRAELLMLRGLIHHHERELEAAELSLREALNLDDLPEARMALADVLLDRARQLRNPTGTATARLQREAEQELRLAIDRSPNALEAIGLLAQQVRGEGIGAVAQMIEPLATAYPLAWAPWRVLGDAHAAEDHHAEAKHAYEQGLKRAKVDELLMPYVQTLSALGQSALLISTIEGIDDLDERDAMLRWQIATILWREHQMERAALVLRALVNDERVQPPLRQRARDILIQMESPSDGGDAPDLSLESSE